MLNSCEGKSVIATGASKGIGKGIAAAFARHGAKVLVVARNLDQAEACAAELRAGGRQVSAFVGDVMNRSEMEEKSHESIFGPSVRASAERAAAARKEADRLACEAWNKRMLGYRGPAQPSPALGDALNLATSISRCAASAATRTRTLRSTSCGDRRRRQSTS